MPVMKIDGHDVGYVEAGPADAPLALFAHCSLAFSGLWSGVMERLADRWRCVALDMPGHGRADRGDPALPLQLQAARYVEGAAAAFGGGPAHLVGLSLGGAVMGRVAHRSPALARSLTLIEPVYFHLLQRDHPEHAEEDERVMAPVHAFNRAGDYHAGARAFMEGWGQPGQYDRFSDAAKDAVARAMRHLADEFDWVRDWPEGQITRADIAALAAPVMLVQGETTQASAKAIIDELAALLPDARREEIAGAGHLSPVDDPAAVAALLADFFTAVERGAAEAGRAAAG